jgi:hypothetical protein
VNTLNVVFLGVIALGSLVQAVFLLLLLRSGLMLMRRVQQLQREYDEQLRPAMAELDRVQRDVDELSDVMGRQSERVREFMARTGEKVESTREVMGPLTRLLALFAVLKTVRKGYGLYRTFRRWRS